MAYKNIGRNKWRTVIIIVSVAMGGYLFIFQIAAFNDQEKSAAAGSPLISSMRDKDFRLLFGLNTDPDCIGYTKQDLQAISNIKGVQKTGTLISEDGFLRADTSDLQQDYLLNNDISGKRKIVEIPLEAKGYDDQQLAEFKKYISQGKISLADSSGKSSELPDVIVSNYYYDLSSSKAKEIRKKIAIGDLLTVKIPLRRGEKIIYAQRQVRVAALLKPEWLYKGEGMLGGQMEIILPQKYLTAMSGKNRYDQISVQVKAGKDAGVNKSIERILADKPFAAVESKFSLYQEDRNQFTRSLTSNLVIVVLILLIAGLNVFNTVRTNLLIRINEFSILRAIGMTVEQLKQMIIKESIVYGLLSSLIAAVIGSYRTYWYNNLLNTQMQTGFNINKALPFKIPVMPILLYAAVVIAICVAAAYACKGRVERLNIVEGLKAIE